MEDHMAKIRALSIVVALGLALLMTARPAAAYVIEALASIPAGEAADKPALEKAIRAAVDDIATHAVAFTPTVVSLREAKLVGDRIYLFVLLADAAGEAEIEVLRAVSARPSPDPR
jgi:hypothetical protein